MVERSRREFLKAASSAAALAWVGCSGESPSPNERASIEGGTPVCSDPFAGGTLVGAVAFIGEANPRLDTKVGSGLAGRLFTDHSNLDMGKMRVDADRFFIRAFAPDRLDVSTPWKIRVRGLVARDKELALSGFDSLVQPMGSFLMECSGNGRGEHFGLMSACEWSGIPLDKVLSQTEPTPKGTRVLVNGFDDHTYPSTRSVIGASWVFTPDQLQRAFLATHMNGQPLSKDHGFPVRLFIPGWYGCAAIKWVDEIRWVDDDAAATSQMIEFASRTHQDGVPELARDYVPAQQDISATPVRIEKWSLAGQTVYRVVGLIWGGTKPTDKLEIQFGANGPYEPVDICPKQITNDTWTLWSHKWSPVQAGEYVIRLRVNDPSQRTNRLDIGHYARSVKISDV